MQFILDDSLGLRGRHIAPGTGSENTFKRANPSKLAVNPSVCIIDSAFVGKCRLR
jgi:hypothetical protein